MIKMNYLGNKNSSFEIEFDGKFSSAIKKYMENDNLPEDSINAIFDNAAKTLSYCPNPKDDSKNQKTGLLIGKVQSGKTSNFISLAALAFDNGYDIAIILGGTKKPLVNQNSGRIKEYFESVKETVNVLSTNENKDYLTIENITQLTQEMNHKIIIVALKSSAQINFLSNLFKKEDFSNHSPVLIIDDEGDEYSLNTQVYKGKQSSTYKAILNLKKSLNRNCFISVTATPQANLLISTLDELSPDFGLLLPPGKGYCGLDVFHSDSTYTVEIPSDEEPLISEGIPNSLKEALADFFVACGIQRCRTEKIKKMSMLIHISQLKNDHEQEFRKVVSLKNEWKTKSSDKQDTAYSSLKILLQKSYEKYKSTTVKNIPSFDEAEEFILSAIKNSQVHKVNGDSVPNGTDEFYDYNIYVGGTMLGRGLTLKGLCITYITRTAKGESSVDTVQQRARWFGYKADILDLCRIYAVSKILEEFRKIRDHENDLWQTIEMTNLQGTNFKNMARIFLLDDGLRLTRTSVAKTERGGFYSWNKQRIFQNDADYIKNNNNVLSAFRNSHNLKTQNIGGGAPYVIASDVDFSEVKNEILDKFEFPTESKLNKNMIERLAFLLDKKNLHPLVDVIWMRDGITSKHNVNPKNQDIGNYTVGRRPKDSSLPQQYAGDDNQFIRKNIMQIQIHTIEDANTKIVSPTLALYIPNEIIEKLTSLVTRAD